MNPLLTKLGVPEHVQAFFNVGELLFPYGNHFEHFESGFHRVPTTQNLWLAGKELTREVVITATAMEAIAYTTLNFHRFQSLDTLSFIAIGNLPHPGQLKWIRANYPRRKFTIVFGKDLLGRLADIKVAAGLRGHEIRFVRNGNSLQVACGNKELLFSDEQLSLNAFEKAMGIRTGIRTAKPKAFDTFLDQLRQHANQ